MILEDTLTHFSKYCDHIFIYDDCSTDNSVEIMKSFDNVTVIQGLEWLPNPWETQSIYRGLVLEKAKGFDMCLCFDADERLVGDLPTEKGGYTFDLYDGYMVKGSKPYTYGKLSELPRMWGIECREIMFYFDPKKAKYDGKGQREPSYSGKRLKSDVKVKHYGKCLSVEHWEETCNFYSEYFPQWREKWEGRKGKAIHTVSDFDTKLVKWEQL